MPALSVPPPIAEPPEVAATLKGLADGLGADVPEDDVLTISGRHEQKETKKIQIKSRARE